MTAQKNPRVSDAAIASTYRPNTPDVIDGLTAEDAPEEFARRAMIRALEEAIWRFGVEPDSIFAMKMRRALNMGPRRFNCGNCGCETIAEHNKRKFCSTACQQQYQKLRAAQQRAPRRRFTCAECGAEAIAINWTQKFCSPVCSRDYQRRMHGTKNSAVAP